MGRPDWKIDNIVKQLSHEEVIVSLNVFITYWFSCVTMKTELNVKPEFYSIFRAYHQGGPLNLDLLPSVVDKQRLKGSYPL